MRLIEEDEEEYKVATHLHKGDEINYVIGAISEEEQRKLDEGTNIAKKAIVEILKNGIDSAMNKYN